MRFTKMHGLGNDYIFLDCTKRAPEDLSNWAVKLSDRHFGVGSDGLICIFPSQVADLQMRVFNADGSEGEMCGNGIRCAGKFAREKGLAEGEQITVETLSGIKHLHLSYTAGAVCSVTADMGIPVPGVPKNLNILDKNYLLYPISMGNPHVVTFLKSVKELDLTEIGPQLERHPDFPNRTNVEFVEARGENRLFMRVWERGSGETLACGTGACAAVAAACLLGKTGREVSVTLPGGELFLQWGKNEHMYLTGPAVTVFEGDWPEKS